MESRVTRSWILLVGLTITVMLWHHILHFHTTGNRFLLIFCFLELIILSVLMYVC
uniref:Uncharacterized protein n=1 Tax=Rhizophora mucronata TaxID=61149 RepID=A0A2P2PVU3_RHIMU